MIRRRLTLGALALAALAAGCDKQPAGPVVTEDASTTGALRVVVLADQSSGATPNFQARPGVRVNLFRLGDSAPLRSVTTNAAGQALFTGLPPGQYVVVPSVRALSAFTGASRDTVTVAAADTAQAPDVDTIRVRIAGRVTGAVTSSVFTPTGQVVARFGGVIVRFFRETAVPGVYEAEPFVLDTTDASGAFEVPVVPGAGRVRLVFDAPGGLADDTLTLGGRSAIESPRGQDTVTTSGGVNPDQNVSANITYSYPNSIASRVFRDLNGNGTFDAGEELVAGDTVRVQLRTADESFRVLAATNVTSTPVTPAALFRSLAPGEYALTLDLAGTRIRSTTRPPQNDTVRVTVPSRSGSVTANFPVPFAP